jgi:hypothetical protein
MISKGCFNSGQKGAFLRQYMEGVVLWLMGNEKNKISLRENRYLAKHFSGKEKPPKQKAWAVGKVLLERVKLCRLGHTQ